MTDATERRLTQWAPWPEDLEAAVREFRGVALLDGWRVWLSDGPRDYAPDDHERKHPIAGGLTLNFHVPCVDSYHPAAPFPGVHHTHPVPAATFNRESWERWLHSCLLASLTHELGESITFERAEHSGPDGEPEMHVRRPFAPLHGPGDDPYAVRDWTTDPDRRRVAFTGRTNPLTPDHA